MSIILRLGFFFVLSLLLFTACEKAPLTEDETPQALSSNFSLLLEADDLSDANLTLDVLVIDGDEEMEEVRGEETSARRLRFHGDCFSIIFPIDIAFPDGTTTTAISSRNARQTIARWIRANRGVVNRTSRISFVYPLNVLLADGTEVEVAQRSGFRSIIAACGRDSGGTAPGGSRDSCFAYVFPVNFTAANGRVQANNAVQIVRLTASQNHQIVFPFDVILSSGETLSITNATTYRSLLQRCGHGSSGSGEDCLDYVYPISYANANGRTATAANAREQAALKANADFMIVFPFDIREGRSTITVTDAAMYRRLLADCP